MKELGRDNMFLHHLGAAAVFEGRHCSVFLHIGAEPTITGAGTFFSDIHKKPRLSFVNTRQAVVDKASIWVRMTYVWEPLTTAPAHRMNTTVRLISMSTYEYLPTYLQAYTHITYMCEIRVRTHSSGLDPPRLTTKSIHLPGRILHA